MGRRKGSKNKRKHTRRKHLPIYAIRQPDLNGGDEARELLLQLRLKLMNAPVEVRKVVIPNLLADLHWMVQVEEDSAPAP